MTIVLQSPARPDDVAPVSCVVELYGYEGGVLTLRGEDDRILFCSVQKSIHGGAPGQFVIELAPGGPDGTEDQITWSQIITVGSLAIIGMQRGNVAGIPMIGVVTEVVESQDWRSVQEGSGVRRVQVIRGQDFTWFFISFNWASLSFLGMVAGQPIGEALGVPEASPALLSQGLFGQLDPSASNPSMIAQGWYNTIMAGAGGVLGRSYVPYQGGNPDAPDRIPFNKALATHWEDYAGVYVPLASWYFAAEGTWMAKFGAMLPPPLYEFFITTAPTGAYTFTGSTSGRATPGYGFTLKDMPLAGTAWPMLVARVTPIPYIAAQANGMAAPATLTGMDMSRWDALPVSGSNFFYNSEIGFDSSLARNMYCLNPTYYRQLFGSNNLATSPYIFSFFAAADPASIHRFGYRPMFLDTQWLADIDGTAAAAGLGPDIPQTIATLTARVASYYHPTPLMARGNCTLPLRPDIIPGTRFRYQPWKAQPLWEFYIDAVTHTYRIGGHSTTRLTLSRGLPWAVYQDAQGLLYAAYTGMAERKDGQYVVRTDVGASGQGPGLTTFNTPDSIKSLLGQIAQVYVTPQAL